MNNRKEQAARKAVWASGRLFVMTFYLVSRFSTSFCFSASRFIGKRLGNQPQTLLYSTFEAEADALKEGRLNSLPRKMLVHWRGEGEEGYSSSFRHPEFLGALQGLTNIPFEDDPPLLFENALNYNGSVPMAPVKLKAFNEALQWASLSDHGARNKESLTLGTYISAAKRCALVATIYEVIAEGDSYDELRDLAMHSQRFDDMMIGGENEESTWAVRVRQFGGEREVFGKERRHGVRARSVSMEKDALLALKPMLLKFGGGVDLRNADCKIYVFDGLNGRMALARKLGDGPRLSSIAPNTRICVTTTPLEPIAAFSLCNIAGIRDGQRIFDPYSGSCAILLAAAMIAKDLQQVGVDIAHDRFINRDHIWEDFNSRGLPQPKAVFRGDSTIAAIRQKARAAVGDEPFDHIITDPPYGVREAIDANAASPLEEMFEAIKDDRDRGKRLLRKGGRLLCFVPCKPEESLMEKLPGVEKAEEAGMRFLLSIEQPLNSKLSRWLVSYECIR